MQGAAETKSSTASDFTVQGNQLYELGKFTEALVCYDSALKLDPTSFAAHHNKGLVLLNLGRYQEALECYDNALKLDLKHVHAHISKGAALQSLRRYQEALDCYDSALKLDPTSFAAHHNKGNIFNILGRYQEGLECYDNTLKLEPKYLLAHTNKGNIFNILGRYQEALACHDTALKLDPKSADAHNSKAWLFYNLEHYQEALTWYEATLKLDSEFIYAHSGKGNALLSLGRYQEALVCFEKTLALNPSELVLVNFTVAHKLNAKYLLPAQGKKQALALLDKTSPIPASFSKLDLTGRIATKETKAEVKPETQPAAKAPLSSPAMLAATAMGTTEHKRVELPVSSPAFAKGDAKGPVAGSSLSMVTHIAWNELKIGTLIGNGSYGDVYQGWWQDTEVAIKLLQLKTLSGPLAKEFAHETDIMRQCQFPSIVRLYGVCTEPGHCAMVMEYMPQKSLRHCLQGDKALSWPQRWQIAVDMAQGLAYLHSREILHRDLKSLNILLDAQHRAKISDFGLAKVKQEVSSSTSKSSSKMVGSIRWRAPELFERRAVATPAVDIYSLGMILWELAALQLPFNDAADEITVVSWINKGEQEQIPDDCPKALADIIRACWARPDRRPSAQELVRSLKQAQAEAEQAVKEKEDKASTATEKAWHFDATTKPAASEVADYALIAASPKDMNKVCEFYLHGPVAGYDVKSVRVIYNPNLNQTFARTLPLIQHRHGQAAFAPKWSQEAGKEQRSEIHTTLENMTAPYQDSNFPNVKLLPVWHGTRADILPSLFKTGFAALTSTDVGYFGKGLYSSYEADYAYKIYCKGALLVNWVAFYSAYPVIDGDMNKLTGAAAYQNYDAHFVPVVPQFPDADCESFVPCQPKQKHRYQEVVVFERSQCLPRYLVELQPSFPKTVTPKVESKGDGKAEHKGAALPKPKAPAYSQAASLAVFGVQALHQSGAGSSAGAAGADALDDDLMASLPLG